MPENTGKSAEPKHAYFSQPCRTFADVVAKIALTDLEPFFEFGEILKPVLPDESIKRLSTFWVRPFLWHSDPSCIQTSDSQRILQEKPGLFRSFS